MCQHSVGHILWLLSPSATRCKAPTRTAYCCHQYHLDQLHLQHSLGSNYLYHKPGRLLYQSCHTPFPSFVRKCRRLRRMCRRLNPNFCSTPQTPHSLNRSHRSNFHRDNSGSQTCNTFQSWGPPGNRSWHIPNGRTNLPVGTVNGQNWHCSARCSSEGELTVVGIPHRLLALRSACARLKAL
jgi:hypothetical protein